MRILYLLLCGLPLLFTACTTSQSARSSAVDDGRIEFVILQMNDVYEIGSLENGRVGGLARVATIKQRLLADNPNVFCVLAGDFLSPSLLGTLKFEGQGIKGRQMVEVMNALGVDLVTFGNHEFDLKMDDLQKRLDESEFIWLGTTVRQKTAAGEVPFHKEVIGVQRPVPDTYTWNIQDADGTRAAIGFFSTTINSNPAEFVAYKDFYRTPVSAYQQLLASHDLVLGVTHLERVQDLKLAGMVPNSPLLMGGHDHEHSIDTVGNTLVTKADANAKTVYVHRFVLEPATGKMERTSTLIEVDQTIPKDPLVDMIVQRWQLIRDESIKEVVPDPEEVVFVADPPLDARESVIRNEQTPLGDYINSGMLLAASDRTQASFFNSGSIRLDDLLSGPITAVDIFRTLPYGGEFMEVELKGRLLEQVLTAGKENKGIGGYLQLKGLNWDAARKKWLIQGQPIEANQNYWVMTTGFLLSGHEAKLEFFTPDHPDILNVVGPDPKGQEDLRKDVRKALIAYLKTL